MIVFRVYEPTDREAVLAIYDSNAQQYFAEGERDEFLEALDSFDADSSAHYWVGICEGRVVAAGGLFIRGETAQLCWGMVSKSEHGKGLGRDLLQCRISWVRENAPQVKSVLCDTAPLTAPFFAKHGFVERVRQANYWGGELELVGMELSWDGIARYKLKQVVRQT